MKCPFTKSNHLIALISLVYIFTGCSDNSVEHSAPPVAGYTQVDFEPSWSPDALNIVYSHADIDNEFTGIYLISSNGTNNRLIVSDFARCPDWSSDGQWIVFTQFDQIFKFKISDNTILQLTTDGKNYFPKWSPDSSLIAYSSSINSSDYNIMVMNTEGNQKRLIDENANYPGWENGSSSLIYFKPAKFNGGSQNGDTLVRYLFSDSSKQTITILSGNDHLVNMYPVFAGDRYIFCSTDNSGSVYIYSMGLDGKNIVKLTTGQSYSPDYSIVKNKIAYTNRTLGNGRLWIMDKNGDNKTQVTN